MAEEPHYHGRSGWGECGHSADTCKHIPPCPGMESSAYYQCECGIEYIPCPICRKSSAHSQHDHNVLMKIKVTAEDMKKLEESLLELKKEMKRSMS
jgi:hypothetical protein